MPGRIFLITLIAFAALVFVFLAGRDSLYDDNERRFRVTDMLAAINEDYEPMVNGESGRKAVEIITAIYESSRNNGKTIFLA